jgi:hypothetical protein
MRKLIRNTSLGFVSIVIVCISIELLSPFFFRKRNLNMAWFTDSNLNNYWFKDDTLIYTKKEVKDERNDVINTNQNTVIALGDSFVHGGSVDYFHSFPFRLQKIFNDNKVDYTVVNLGVTGYSNDQEFRLFDEYMKHGNRPKVVVWAFYANDIYENQTQATYDLDQNGDLIPLDSRNNWIYKRQVFYDAIPFERKVKNRSFILNQTLFLFELQKIIPKMEKYSHNYTLWSIDKITKEVDLMDQLASQYGFSVYYVLVYPQAYYMPHEQVDSKTQWALIDNNRIYNILHSKNNFIPLDFSETQSLISASVSGAQTTIVDSIFSDGKTDTLIQKGTRHFNERGYQLFAERVFDVIRQTIK